MVNSSSRMTNLIRVDFRTRRILPSPAPNPFVSALEGLAQFNATLAEMQAEYWRNVVNLCRYQRNDDDCRPSDSEPA